MQLIAHLLGTVEFKLDHTSFSPRPAVKELALLAYLIMNPRAFTRDELAALLWPEKAPASARASLRQALYRLRRLIEDAGGVAADYLAITRQDVRFRSESPHWLDVRTFQEHLQWTQRHTHHSLETCPQCAAHLQEASQLYDGEFLAGLQITNCERFEEWRLMLVEQLRREASQAYLDLANRYEQRRDYAAALDALQANLKITPWSETTHRQIMRVYALSGDSAAARRQYETLRELLAAEYNTTPGPETRALVNRIEQNLQFTGEQEIPNPYVGLHPFDASSASFFYGRDAALKQLLTLLVERKLIVLVGPSGSGKTSFIQAGLIPRLQNPEASSAWRVLAVRPGPHPFEALVAALQPPGGHWQESAQDLALQLRMGWRTITDVCLSNAPVQYPDRKPLIVIDQFEELYTLVDDPEERTAFLARITATAGETEPSSPTILLAMRADFAGQLLSHRPSAEAMQRGGMMLGPMNESEMRAAITEPALNLGVAFQEGLVERLLEDVRNEPGGLPLLQFALNQLWIHRQLNLLTHAGYEQIGGVSGALSRYAEHIYARLDADDQERIRHILLRLVQPGHDTADTRRRATRTEFSDADWRLVQDLADARLLVLDRDSAGQETVELAHEALLGHWSRLRDWLEDDRAFRLWRQRLHDIVRDWKQDDRSQDYLLRGALLTEAEAWIARRPAALAPEEQDFITIATTRRNETTLNEEQRRQRELETATALAQSEKQQAELARRTSKRLRWLMFGLLILLAMSLLVGLYAQRQRLAAQASAIQAQSLNLTSSARLALDDDNPQLALSLALAANAFEPPPNPARQMLSAAAYHPGAMRVFADQANPIAAAALSPDSHFALAANRRGQLFFWDLTSAGEPLALATAPSAIKTLAISPDTRTAFSGDADGNIIQWRVADGKILQTLAGHSDAVLALAFSPDGRQVLSGSADDSLILWDVATGAILQRLQAHRDDVVSLDISPDGAQALSGSADRSVILWDLREGKAVHVFAGSDDTVAAASAEQAGHSNTVWGVGFTLVGALGYSVSADRQMILLDLQQGVIDKKLPPLSDGAFSAAMNPRDGSIIAGLLDGRLVVQELLFAGNYFEGRRWQMQGHSDRVTAISVATNGQRALSVGGDGSMILWDLHNGAELMRLRDEFYGTSVDVSPDARTCLAALWTGRIRLFDCASGQTLREWQAHEDMIFAGAYFTADGRRIVSGSGDIFASPRDTSVRVWNVATGEQLYRFDDHTDRVWDVAVDGSGRYAASASHDGTVRLYDLQTGEGRLLLDVSPQAARSLAFSPDGKTMLVGLAKGASDAPDYALRLIDIASGEEIRRFAGHSAVVADVAFSPDGRQALSGSVDKSLILWDVDSGQALSAWQEHIGSLTAVRFSPDGAWAASTGSDAQILLWDVASGQVVRRLAAHNDVVLDLAFAPDGKTLFSIANDDTVRRWRLDRTQEELNAWIASNRYAPELTCEQREQYYVLPLCE